MLFIRETASVLFAYATTFILVVLTIVGIAANTLVIVAVLGDKKMRGSSINLLLMNLALADFLFIAVFVPLWVPLMAYATMEYTIEDIFFPIDWCIAKTVMNSSIFTYVMIATERYAAVITPLKSHWYASTSGIFVCVIAIWIVSFFFSLPYYFVYDYCREACGVQMSVINWDACLTRVNKVKFIPTYYLSDFVATYLLPVVISVPLYSRMCWALRPQHFPKKIGHSNASLPSDSLANRRRVIKMLAICVVIFFVCYTPTAIHIILSFVHWTAHESTPIEWRSDLVNFITLLLPVASTINPFIYTLYCSAFRERVKQLLKI